MNLSDLLKKDLVEKFESDKEQIGNEMDSANKNLASAKNMLGIQEWEWSHTAAYNAMLHVGRALMFSKGYRPKGRDYHVAVVDFVEAVFSAKIPKEVRDSFDRGRKRRHEFMYDKVDVITPEQARNLVEKAEMLINKTKELLKS
ncbi:MAG: HEPN domain-containing protein [Thaumarchaeota archaeon]|nr:HEPN domain-containing protein [Nitrososphaerota archaeon]